ncbi:unnamed protein product, partial [Trichobilharzia regenti]
DCGFDSEGYGNNSSTISQSVVLPSSGYAPVASSLNNSSPLGTVGGIPSPSSSILHGIGEVTSGANTPNLHGGIEWMRKLAFRYRRIREIYNCSSFKRKRYMYGVICCMINFLLIIHFKMEIVVWNHSVRDFNYSRCFTPQHSPVKRIGILSAHFITE